MRIIAKGATSQTLYLEVLDSTSTTGGRKTGLAYNTASLVGSYVRNGAARTAITLATQTVSGAWSSGGFVEVDATNMQGLYRLDVPDAAFASGVDSVVVTLRGATGMVQVSEEVQLIAADVQNATSLGLSRLDAAVTTRATPAQILVTPANLLASDASGFVTVATNNDKAGYTASTVSDKTGYALSAAGVSAIWDQLLSAITTASTIGKLIKDNLDAAVSSRSSHTAADVWTSGTRTLTALGAPAVQSIWDAATSALVTAGSIGKLLTDNVNATISSRSTHTAADVWTNSTRSLTGNVTVGNYATGKEPDTMVLDTANGIETGVTVRMGIRQNARVLAAKLSGAGTGTIKVRNLLDTKDAITATVDSNGNRTVVSNDFT